MPPSDEPPASRPSGLSSLPVAAEPRARPFLGWRVVAAAFLSQMLSAGLCFNAFGVFVVPVAESFGTGRGVVSLGLGIGMVVMGLLGPALGGVADRGPVRALMVSGFAVLGAGLHLTSLATSLWQAGLAFALLVAGGAAMTGPIPTISIVCNWFVRRRGLALGVTVAGATVASMAAPAVAAWLIESEGWRRALRVMGTWGPAAAIPLLWWLVVRRPEDVGQAPDGDTPLPAAGTLAGSDAGDLATRQLLRDPNLWLASFGFAFLFASPIVMSIHLVPYAGDLGIEPLRAVVFFSVMAPCSLLGKLVFGAVADRIDMRHALYTAIVVLAATWWLLLSAPGYRAILVAGAVFGLGVGAVGPLQGIVVAACFGRRAVGRVMGIGGVLGLPIVAGSGTFVGFLFDAQGSYRLGFLLQLGTLAISALLFGLLRIPAVEPGTELVHGEGALEEA